MYPVCLGAPFKLNTFNKYYFNVLDIKEGCYVFGGALKERKNWTLQQCDTECCQGVNCNTQTPTLSKAAFTVFAPTGNTKKYGWFVNKINKCVKFMVSSSFSDNILARTLRGCFRGR